MERTDPIESKERTPKRLAYVQGWKGDFAVLEIPNEMDIEKEKGDYHKDGGSNENHANLVEWLVQHGAKNLDVEVVLEH